MKKCPFCAEEVLDDAVKCKHCHSMLNGESNNGVTKHRIVKIYPTKSIVFGDGGRKRTEKKLFAQGYKIVQEEETKEFDSGQACCLSLIFFPLALFGHVKKIKVTYEKSSNDSNDLKQNDIESKSAIPKKYWWTAGIICFILFCIFMTIASHQSTPSFNTNIDHTKNSAIKSEPSISERKNKLGLDYEVIKIKVSADNGRTFSALLLPNKPTPTVEQLKMLGEIVRDEYKNDSFTGITFYDNKEAAESEGLYNTDTANGLELTKEYQRHLLAQYDKNNRVNKNVFEIYSGGFTNCYDNQGKVIKIEY